jgi:3,4-dihydroxy 2-butanone 4-phosphate synthase/GTP cyclohydrolase II
MACLYAEAFGSIDCDCRQQIEDGLKLVQTRPPAMLIHFYGTDGRGLGFLSKLRMIEIEQKEGLAPYQATVQMSRQYADYRCLRMVPEVLAKLGITVPLQLVTNNPEKRSALAQAGVNIQRVVNSRIHQKMLSEFGRRELEEKIRVLGHEIRLADADER